MGSPALPGSLDAGHGAAPSLVHALFQQSATGIALVDVDGRYLAVNGALCELLGRSEAELLARSWQDVTHPDDVSAGETLVEAVRRGEERELQTEKRYVRPDGALRWALLGSSPLWDGEGRAIGFLSQVVDITARKHAEEAVRTEQGLLELLTAVTVAPRRVRSMNACSPTSAAVPAVAIGIGDGPVTAAWVIGLYILIQQLEGNLLMPLIQQRMVRLPPALTIFAILGFALLFGPLGVLFAAPLLVVGFILVKKLWVRETLDEDTSLPGDSDQDGPLP
jgi:PAS domain S-box-containing protein